MNTLSDIPKLRVVLHSSLQRDASNLDLLFEGITTQENNGEMITLEQKLRDRLNISKFVDYSSTIEHLLKERAEAEAAIQAKFNQFGWFGQPTSDMQLGHGGRGYYRHYQKGSIFWLPTWGAHEVHGAIRAKYASLGWDGSYLGYPITDELPSGNSRYSNFEYGTIVWTQNTGAFIHPSITVLVERHQLGAWLLIRGQGFTPGGLANFSIEGLEGTVSAIWIGIDVTGRADGTLPDNIWWDGRTWHNGGVATLVGHDQVTGRTATYPIPALH